MVFVSEVDSGTIAVIGNTPFTFYAAGRHWVFYEYSGHAYYNSTDDLGASWAGRTLISGVYTGDMGYIVDGTELHYCWLATGPNRVMYRKGTLNADGTISWAAAEQTVDTPGTSISFSRICLDTDGYPWVSYTTWTGGGSSNNKAAGSSTKNGIWTHRAGSPWTPIPSWVGALGLYPLAGGKLLLISGVGGSVIKSCLWNGASWGSVKNVSSETISGIAAFRARADVVADGGVVYLVYNRYSDYVTRYVEYVSGSDSWTSPITVGSAAEAETCPKIMRWSDGTMHVIWMNGTTIYRRSYMDGEWQTETFILSDTFANKSYISGSNLSPSDDALIGVLYVRDATPDVLLFFLLSRTPATGIELYDTIVIQDKQVEPGDAGGYWIFGHWVRKVRGRWDVIESHDHNLPKIILQLARDQVYKAETGAL